MSSRTGSTDQGDLERVTGRHRRALRRLPRPGVWRHLGPVLCVMVLAALVIASFAAFATASPAVPAFDKYDGLSGQTPDPATRERGAHFLLPKTMSAVPGVAATGTGKISGKVTDSSGTGLPAVVVVTDITGVEIDYVFTTYPDGSYLITGLPNVKVKVVTVNYEGYIDEWYNNVVAPGNWEGAGAAELNLATTATRTGINFTLAMGKTISGRVTNGSVGLEGVYVDAYDQDGDEYNYGETDAGGYYEITGLPAGQYLVATDNYDGYVDEWYNDDPILLDPEGILATLVDVRTSSASNRDFVLTTGREISGTVTNSTGTPLADVEVRVQPVEEDLDFVLYELTDGTGAYSFAGLPSGEYVINTANDQGYVDEWYNNDQAPGDIFGWEADFVDVRFNDASGIDFALDPGYFISGSVTDNATGLAPGGPGMFVNFFAGDYGWCGTEFVDSETGPSYSTWALPAGTYYASATDYHGSGEFQLGSSYIDEWYDDLPVGQYRVVDADPIVLGPGNATGIDFGLDRMAYYEQNDPRIVYSGVWTTFSKPEASGGSYAYSSASDATATFYFKGTRYDWIATTGTLSGLAEVYINTESVAYDLDLFSDPAAYRVKVWSQHVRYGVYKVTIVYDSDSAAGKRITLDALEISGELVDPPPTVTALSPANGPATGGTNVTITGTKLTSATEVHFGGVAATNVHVVSPTQVTCTSPSHDQGRVDVTVTTASGTSPVDGIGNDFTFTTPAPTVTGLSPVSGTTTGGTTVTITGAYLTGATAVSFGGTAATGFTINSATEITATTPAHAAGLAEVTVTTPGGGTSATAGTGNDYTYVAPVPTVTEMGPSSGTTSGGTSVTIAGTGLFGATAVNFGGAGAASFTVDSATQITATSPAHVAGTVEVTVITAGGTSSTEGTDNDYTFVAPVPTVTGLAPSSGSTLGGATVTLTGTGFIGATGVTFGDATATNVTVVSPTQVTCTSPVQDAGTVDVQITTAGGTSSADGAGNDFTYTVAPLVTRYDQTNPNIVRTGTWVNYNSPGSYQLSYGRSSTSLASATIWFNGTQLDYIAFKGTTTGKADVYVDGVKVTGTTPINLYSSPVAYQQLVFSTGPLTNGLHSVKIVRSASSATGKFLTLDAVDIYGTIAPPPTRYQQADARIVKTGVWANFTSASASGGSYGRSNTADATATITFTGTRLDWIGMKGTTGGTVEVYLDGASTPAATINLNASKAVYQQVLWSTGTLADGLHTVLLKRIGTGTLYLNLDAVDIWETTS